MDAGYGTCFGAQGAAQAWCYDCRLEKVASATFGFQGQ